MRQYKFRAWHNGAKQMLFENRIGDVFKWYQEHQPIEIMQFTGLYDKNGNEIYLSDFIKSNGGDVMLVVWRNDLASFALRKDGWAYDHYFGEAVDSGNTEVIGNIHEHIHLLQ